MIRRPGRRTGRRRIALTGFTVSVVMFGAATGAVADTNYSWVGGDVSGDYWSMPGNWGGDQVPQAPVGTLTFGDLGDPCNTCGVGDNDGDLTVDRLNIDLSGAWSIIPVYNGGSLTLNGDGGTPNIGLDATQDSDWAMNGISVPVTVAAEQTWDVSGNAANEGSELSVPDIQGNQPLTVDFSDGATLTTDTLDSSSITADGDGTLESKSNVFESSTPGALPMGGVTLDDGASLAASGPGTSSSGSITVSGGSDDSQPVVAIGKGNSLSAEASLAVTGDVNLDQWADLYFSLDNDNTVAGAPYSSLTATGDVDLSGATVYLEQGSITVDYGDSEQSVCEDLAGGTTFPVLTAQGSITGDLTYFDTSGNFDTLSPGQTSAPIPLQADYCPNTDLVATLTYGTNAITATIVEAPSLDSDVSDPDPVITGTPTVGSTVTATSNGSWTAYPAPSYSYQWVACSTTTCTAIPGATGSAFTLTSAQAGQTVAVDVLATNAVGSADDLSNGLGPVPALPTPTPTPSSSQTTPVPTPAPAAVSPSVSQIQSSLDGISHPSGKKAVAALEKTDVFKTSFSAPGGGTLSVVWTTRVTIGKGKHEKTKTVTVATGSGRTGSATTVSVVVRVTAAGKALLKQKPSGLPITDTETFGPTAGARSTVAKTFRL